MDYKQIKQKAREDVYNVLAYYPKKRNYQRLDRILGLSKYLDSYTLKEKFSDREVLNQENVNFLNKYVPDFDIEKKLANPSQNAKKDLFFQEHNKYLQKCITRSWVDKEGKPTTDPNKRYREIEKPINSPECNKLMADLKSLQNKENVEKAKLMDNVLNEFKSAIFKRIYSEIFKHGLDFMNSIKVVFKKDLSEMDPLTVGYWEEEKHLIAIRTHVDPARFKKVNRIPSGQLPEENIYDTLVHELMHAYSDSLPYAVKKTKEIFSFDLRLFPKEADLYRLDINSYDLYKKTINPEYDSTFDIFSNEIARAKQDEYEQYAYGSAESYARGASPALRLSINKLKGKSNQALNDDITGLDIFNACGKGLEVAIVNQSFNEINSKDDGALEFLFRRTIPCRNYVIEFRKYIESVSKSEKTKETKSVNLKDNLPNAIRFLEEKYQTDEEFKNEFLKAAIKINDIAKADKIGKQSAIAEMRDIRKLFKRFLTR